MKLSKQGVKNASSRNRVSGCALANNMDWPFWINGTSKLKRGRGKLYIEIWNLVHWWSYPKTANNVIQRKTQNALNSDREIPFIGFYALRQFFLQCIFVMFFDIRFVHLFLSVKSTNNFINILLCSIIVPDWFWDGWASRKVGKHFLCIIDTQKIEFFVDLSRLILSSCYQRNKTLSSWKIYHKAWKGCSFPSC